ncbi:MAG: response regulator [Chloroflexota bacterium]
MDTYELMRFILERNGYITFLTMNGRDGINAARKQKPDLILMDISMPEMDGLEAARRIKKDPITASIPIIAVTAHALPGDRQRALEAGCTDYITKPINLNELVEVVNRAFRKS